MESIGSNPVCQLCNSQEAKPLWEKGNAIYYRCDECHLVFQFPPPEASQLREFYNENYYVKQEGEDPTIGYGNYLEVNDLSLARLIVNSISKLDNGDGKRLLDVGCAVGNIMQVAIENGWEAYGVELSSWSSSIAKKKGLIVYNQLLQDCKFENEYFDAITMFDVIEHFSDVNEVLREIRRILKPNGLLIIETPNIESFTVRYVYAEKSELVQPDAHLVLFSLKTLNKMLKKHGFEIINNKLLPLSRTYKEFTKMIIRKSVKKVLSLVNYRIGPFDLKNKFKRPDDTKYPSLTINDCLQIIAHKID